MSSCGVGGGVRVLSRAGRRSAGLGSDGGERTHTHAVGVRAAWSRLRPADEARGRRGRGDMFGRGSYAIVRRCKSSIFL